VATGDRFAFQLASEMTIILLPVRAGVMARIGPKEVRERYGVEPKQVPDLIARSVATCVWRIADLCRKSAIRHTQGGRDTCQKTQSPINRN
jgi:hypothetical protein